MAETTTKVPVRGVEWDREGTLVQKTRDWHPFESLHKEIDRIFEDFDRHFGVGFGRYPTGATGAALEPVGRRELAWGVLPAVDIVEHEKDYEITAELPGMGEGDIEVKLYNDTLTIKGEKKAEREEKGKNRYVSERHYGLFQRSFRLPEGVDGEKIDARFTKGVLTVTILKSAADAKKERKITINAG